MIEQVGHITSVYAIFKAADQLVINHGGHLAVGNKKLPLEMPGSYRSYNDIISIISKGNISLYDPYFNLLRSINDSRIDGERAGIETFNIDTFGVFIFEESNGLDVYTGGKRVAHTKDFFGKLLSETHRLNYSPGTFDNPKYLRCSNFADTKTYFEFQSGPQDEIVPNYIVRDLELSFPMIRDGVAYITTLDMRSGSITWEHRISNTTFNIDESDKSLVSFWSASSDYVQSGSYQIIDLSKRMVTVGMSNGLSVGPGIYTPHHLQYMHGEHIYFVENRASHAGEGANPVRFGRMNTQTKNVDILSEVGASPLSPLSEVVVHSGRVYVRNSNNELFVYRLPSESKVG